MDSAKKLARFGSSRLLIRPASASDQAAQPPHEGWKTTFKQLKEIRYIKSKRDSHSVEDVQSSHMVLRQLEGKYFDRQGPVVFFAVVTVVLGVVVNELCIGKDYTLNEDQVDIEGIERAGGRTCESDSGEPLKIALSCLTALLVILVVLQWRIRVKIGKANDNIILRKYMPPGKEDEPPTHPSMYALLLLEVAVVAVHPFPSVTTYWKMSLLGSNIIYRFESIAVAFMVLRLFHVWRWIRLMANFRYVNMDDSFVLRDLATIEVMSSNTRLSKNSLALKVLVSKYPVRVISSITCLLFLSICYLIRLTEGPAHTPHSEYWWDQMWVTITQGTTGYGGSPPETHSGRFAAVLMMFLGPLTVSFMTATTTRNITLSAEEQRVLNNLEKNRYEAELQKCATSMLQYWWRGLRHSKQQVSFSHAFSHGIGSKNSYQVRVMITNRFYIALEEYERHLESTTTYGAPAPGPSSAMDPNGLYERLPNSGAKFIDASAVARVRAEAAAQAEAEDAHQPIYRHDHYGPDRGDGAAEGRTIRRHLVKLRRHDEEESEMDDASRLSDDDRGSVPKKQQEEHGNFGGIDSDTFMEGMEDIKDVKFGLEELRGDYEKLSVQMARVEVRSLQVLEGMARLEEMVAQSLQQAGGRGHRHRHHRRESRERSGGHHARRQESTAGEARGGARELMSTDSDFPVQSIGLSPAGGQLDSIGEGTVLLDSFVGGNKQAWVDSVQPRRRSAERERPSEAKAQRERPAPSRPQQQELDSFSTEAPLSFNLNSGTGFESWTGEAPNVFGKQAAKPPPAVPKVHAAGPAAFQSFDSKGTLESWTGQAPKYAAVTAGGALRQGQGVAPPPPGRANPPTNGKTTVSNQGGGVKAEPPKPPPKNKALVLSMPTPAKAKKDKGLLGGVIDRFGGGKNEKRGSAVEADLGFVSNDSRDGRGRDRDQDDGSEAWQSESNYTDKYQSSENYPAGQSRYPDDSQSEQYESGQSNLSFLQKEGEFVSQQPVNSFPSIPDNWLSSDLGPERRNRGGGVQGGSPGPAESTDADSIPPPGVQAGQRFGDSVQSVGSSRFGDA